MATNLIGATILNQYRVEAFIASGGMGAVYRVWDLKRNVSLAMKVLHAELAEDPSVFKRFQREARALKKLAHPNIVPFYGLFQTQDFAFLLERFVDGPTLKDILRQRQGQPLPIEEALVYLKALSAAVGYAHANGVVHCDIKPGNVMIDPGGNVYLTDFGIARHTESTTTTVGTTGTPAYMAPEQIRGEPVTPATDVYALGVVLFEMLTGQRPFRGDEAGTEQAGPTAAERIRYAHLNLMPPDPRSLNPAIPPQLAQAVLHSLVKQPEGRYKSTNEFFNAACLSVGTSSDLVPDRIPAIEISSNFQTEIVHKQEGFPPGQAISSARAFSSYLNANKLLFAMGSMVIICGILIIFLLGKLLTRNQPQQSKTKLLATPQVLNEKQKSLLLATATDSIHILPTKSDTRTATLLPQTVTKILQPAIVSTTSTLTLIRAPLTTMTFTYTPRPIPTLEPTHTPTPPYHIGSTQVSVKDGMVMVYVPNSPGLESFWIDRTEVTNGMYAHCVDQGVCATPTSIGSNTHSSYYGNPSYDDYPVIHVDWFKAVVYCSWAGRRLPTEAEWVEAAGGNDGREYPWGEGLDCGKANYGGCNADTLPVDNFSAYPSPYGTLNMVGNVWEWVQDECSFATSTRACRIQRGGSWINPKDVIKISYSYKNFPDNTGNDLGFRCALSP